MSERQVTKTSQEAEKISTLTGVITSCAGSNIAPVYKRVYDEKLNKMIVKKVDETDIYEFIQASKSTTDLANLQQRMIALGEIPAVDPTLGSNDLTVFPDNIHDVYKMVNDVDGSFNQLPDSVKSIFGTKEVYLQSLLDGSYQSKLVAAMSAPKEKEVKQEGETKHE